MGRRRKKRRPQVIGGQIPRMTNMPTIPTRAHRCGECAQCKAAIEKATAKRKIRALKYQT